MAMLKPALVEKVLSQPPGINNPKVTKINMMDKAYNTAFSFPLAFVLLLFKKKATFMGINGNTQGVNKAASPHARPVNNINHHDLPSMEASSPDDFILLSVVPTGALFPDMVAGVTTGIADVALLPL